MPHGRLPIASGPLDTFSAYGKRVKGANIGCFNAGVFIVRRKSDGQKAAYKKIGPAEVLSGDARNEASILRGLRHGNVVKYLDAFVDDRSAHSARAGIYMEYCSDGTLHEELKHRYKEASYFREKEVWKIFRQLVDAVAYIHHGIYQACDDPAQAREQGWIGIVHRDIKPSNIFLRENRHSGLIDVVLADFGVACTLDETDWHRQTRCGDPRWRSPEQPACSMKSDNWQLGMVIAAVCELEGDDDKPRFLALDVHDKRRRYRVFRGLHHRYSKALDAAIFDLTRTQPNDRPYLTEFARTM